jgi:tetratricopeptide (TPR) repeat protein
LDKVLPEADDDSTDKTDKKRKLTVKEPTHQEAASSDIDVGNYYVQTHNWKAALSRFQSAMVLDPNNPDVFWGLAETERHLGDFADARTHYQKVLDYDPDSRHGKDARKALKDPEIANGKNSAPSPSSLELPK